jgi:dTDP-4-dehydrorhamnose 3,5-epimerase
MNKAIPIPGVHVSRLAVIPDERGWLMEALRNDDPHFTQFGQAYISATYPGVVKAWHLHAHQTDTFICVAGMIKLVLLYTGYKPDDPTAAIVNEFYLGPQNPIRVTVPKWVYHGWKCISLEPSLVLNIPDKPYNYEKPDELRVAPHGVLPYDWSRQDG